MSLVDGYEWLKSLVAAHDPSVRALFHVHVGMLIFVAASLVTRRCPSSPAPLLVLLVVELANEALDMSGYWSLEWSWRWADALSDIGHTMIWPLILSLIARSFRRRQAARAEVEGEAETA